MGSLQHSFLSKASLRAQMRHRLKSCSLSTQGVLNALRFFLKEVNKSSTSAPFWGVFYPLSDEPQILSLLDKSSGLNYAWCWPVCLKSGQLVFYHVPVERMRKIELERSKDFRQLLRGIYSEKAEFAELFKSLLKAEPQGRENIATGFWVAKQELAGVLLPALAIDKVGYRLGRGGGYYDRFLADFSGFKVAVIFHCQLLQEEIPRDSWDQDVDWVVTEEGIYQRKEKELLKYEVREWKL